MDIDVFPNVIDYWGPSGIKVFYRLQREQMIVGRPLSTETGQLYRHSRPPTKPQPSHSTIPILPQNVYPAHSPFQFLPSDFIQTPNVDPYDRFVPPSARTDWL